MATVQNLLGVRLSNRVLAPVWNSAHIEQVDILWDETLALEGRAAYYDRAGALKDVIQNHLLQVLCLIAMEPPVTLGERDLRDRKLDVLRCVRPMTEADVVSHTRRARYSAGQLADTGGALAAAEIRPSNPLPLPSRGTRILLRGRLRYNVDHAWYAIDPVDAWDEAHDG